MNYWRMAFRCGNGGYDLFGECIENKVAIITYIPIENTDLSDLPSIKKTLEWKSLAPTQKSSIERFVKEFRKDDIIYVKHGRFIIGKGTITKGYQFIKNTSIFSPDYSEAWHHVVSVEWDNNFNIIELLTGAELHTVHPLEYSIVQQIEKLQEDINKNQYDNLTGEDSANGIEEGEIEIRERQFRKRNKALIDAKKMNSNGYCEVCGFNYKKFYKEINKDHLVAHHLYPIGSRENATITKLEDIALVCSNCHTVIHSSKPIFEINKLKSMIRR